MVKRNLLSIVFLVGLIIPAVACNVGVRVIKGSGNVITENRQVSNFDSIELSGSGIVILNQGDNESLTIETDDNVVEYVKSDVEDGILKLSLVTGNPTGVNIQTFSRLVFYVDVDDLKGLTVSGSGMIESDNVETSRLELNISGSGAIQITDLSANDVNADISGSGEIDLAGNVTTQDARINGSGKYLGGDLCSEAVSVSVSGSGSATVCATASLNADVSGSGSVSYYGQPSLNTSGSGSENITSLGEK